MPVVQAAPGVVEQVQMLDQQVTAMAVSRALANQRLHFGEGNIVSLPALELAFAADAVPQLVHRGDGDGREVGRLAGRVHAALWPEAAAASN